MTVRAHLKIFGSAFATGFTGAVAPGPLLVVCAYQAINAGFAAGMLTIVGHAAAELVLVIALTAGLARFLTKRPGVFRWVKIVAGIVLLTLGGVMLWSAPSAEFDAGTGQSLGTSPAQPILMGAAVSVGNPYFILWWATVGMGLLGGAARQGRAGVVTFYVGHELSDAAWYAFVAGSLALGRSAVLGPTSYRVLLGTSGAFMIAFGLFFALARRRGGSPETETQRATGHS